MTRTIPRGRATIKLRSATRITYFFQNRGGQRYERDVPPADFWRTFEGNPGMSLRVRLEDSQHVVRVKHPEAQLGYLVAF